MAKADLWHTSQTVPYGNLICCDRYISKLNKLPFTTIATHTKSLQYLLTLDNAPHDSLLIWLGATLNHSLKDTNTKQTLPCYWCPLRSVNTALNPPLLGSRPQLVPKHPPPPTRGQSHITLVTEATDCVPTFPIPPVN